jgi:hypothetical protein
MTKNNLLVLIKIRNNIAHQYEDEPKQASEALNAIYNAKAMLETIYLSLKRRCIFDNYNYGFFFPHNKDDSGIL